MKYALVTLAFVPLVLYAGTSYLLEFVLLLALTLGGLRVLEMVDGRAASGDSEAR